MLEPTPSVLSLHPELVSQRNQYVARLVRTIALSARTVSSPVTAATRRAVCASAASAAATTATATTAVWRTAAAVASSATAGCSSSAAAATPGHTRKIGSFGDDLPKISRCKLEERTKTYLEITTSELAIVQHEGLLNQARFGELNIRVPAYAH